MRGMGGPRAKCCVRRDVRVDIPENICHIHTVMTQLKLFGKRRKDRRGGARVGAGRPKLDGSGESHLVRPSLSRHHPVHVVVRLVPRLRRLRSRSIYKMVRRAFCFACARFFRIVHYSVQGDHIHLICEAANKRALARGMQGFLIRVAKGLNRIMGRRGSVFRDRYHAEPITSPRYARNALSYVLNNARKHAERMGDREAMKRSFVDPYSSAAYFDGWKRECLKNVPAPEEGPAPVVAAQTWLLREGWRKHHPLIATWEFPAAREG